MMAPLTPHPARALPFNMGFAVALVVLLFAGVVVVAFLLRKFMREQAARSQEDWTTPKTDVENPSAFMAASMQGVIEKLRTQEKELARLHLLAQERAQESERLTEEVTRNMPTGLLLVNATGRDQLRRIPRRKKRWESGRCAIVRTRKFWARNRS